MVKLLFQKNLDLVFVYVQFARWPAKAYRQAFI